MIFSQSIFLGLFTTLIILLDSCYADKATTFLCKNGNEINMTKTCNGIDDCGDKSDERFEVCVYEVCEDQFRCNYGGCIDIESRCDKTPDCWDNTDENKYECADENDDLIEMRSDLQGNCDELEMSCIVRNNTNCITWDKVCNGEVDCADGKDESLELCSALPCSDNGFRCADGACINLENACNHLPDCKDGSDELDDVCLKNKSWYPEIKNPNVTFDHDSNTVAYEAKTWSRSFCKIEDPTGALIAEDLLETTITYMAGDIVEKGVVSLKCKDGYEIFGSSFRICDGTKWDGELPKCAPICKLKYQFYLKKECLFNNRPFDCISSPAYIGTTINVSCAPGYESKNAGHSSGTLRCGDDGKWSVHEAMNVPKCVPKCGTVWDEKQPKPWIGSLFQRGTNPLFEFKSFVTILSPYVVVASAHVFKSNTIPGVSSQEPLLFAIAEGNHTKAFSNNDDHGYKLHNVSEIYINRKSEVEHKLAIITLIQPFQIGPNVQPVCLNYAAQHQRETEKYEVRYPVVTKAENNRHFLVGIVADDKNIYSINTLQKDLSEIMKKYEPEPQFT